MPSHPKAPKGCYWRGPTLWGRAQIGGKIYKWSLETDDVRLAKTRRAAGHKELIARKHHDDRKSLRDVISAWEEWLPRQVSPGTVERYAVSIGQLDPFLADKYLDEIKAPLIADIVESRQKVDRVTNATVKRDLVALSSIINFACDKGWRDDNPVLPRLKRIKERRDPIVLPSPEDIEKLLQRAPGALGAIIAAARATGCRQEELAGAKCAQLDLKGQRLTVIGKGNKLRVIDIEPFGGTAIFAGLAPGIAKAPLFRTEDGTRFLNISSRVAGFAREIAGRDETFSRFRFHDLRHLHAVEWLRSGRSVYDLQQRLGHRNIATTEVYLQYLTPQEKRIAKGEVTATKAATSTKVVSSKDEVND